tara:strand:- start:134 stop:295 length:162 start_codon:yes stop_codon:yes gene_type:complete
MLIMQTKEQKPVKATLVKILKDKPKGEPISKIHSKIDELRLPGGPAWINGKWW